jgi:hypothetical protein
MMVELETLQAVSYIMGSFGVFLAAIYYIFECESSKKDSGTSFKMTGTDLGNKASSTTHGHLQDGLRERVLHSMRSEKEEVKAEEYIREF